MENFETISKELLSQLPKRASVAFAVACAERAQKIISAYDDNPDISENVINSIWEYINGKDFTDQKVDELKKYFLDNATNDEDMDDSIVDAQTSVTSAISSISNKTISSSYAAAVFANNAIDAYEDGNGSIEEQQWQVNLLDALTAISQQEQPDYKALISSMNKEEPQWYQTMMAD